MSPTGSFTATPRGRRAFGTITRRGRGASPSARSGRWACGSGVVVVISVVIVHSSPAALENAPAAGFARRGGAAPRSSRSSPARLRHAGQLADDRSLAEADPAQAELPHVSTGPTADLAAVIPLGLELRGLLRLADQAELRHLASPLGRAERHAERLEQGTPFLVGLRGGHDRDLESAEPVDLVVIDLREHELLLEAQRVVATP